MNSRLPPSFLLTVSAHQHLCDQCPVLNSLCRNTYCTFCFWLDPDWYSLCETLSIQVIKNGTQNYRIFKYNRAYRSPRLTQIFYQWANWTSREVDSRKVIAGSVQSRAGVWASSFPGQYSVWYIYKEPLLAPKLRGNRWYSEQILSFIPLICSVQHAHLIKFLIYNTKKEYLDNKKPNMLSSTCHSYWRI